MPTAEEKLQTARRVMIERDLRARGIRDQRILDAFEQIPRERFVPPGHVNEAYADYPLPIGYGQTISQPYVVALMVQELAIQPHHRVLDVGAGSGYQTAILAALGREVYAIERIGELTDKALQVLRSLGIENVTIQTGDGSMGWAEYAPFDRIICGAGAPQTPGAWIEQLSDGGRIILPVGDTEVQTLMVVDKSGDKVRRRRLCDVRFVKLIGEQAWPGY